MKANPYVHVRSGAPEVARDEERQAFDTGLALLEAAKDAPGDTARTVDALRYMQQLWGFLIKDLSNPANDLSEDLRANLISIGLWVLKESDAILAGKSENWAALIDINRTVREGLSA